MNSSIIRFVLGYVLKVEAVLMLLPCIVAVLYHRICLSACCGNRYDVRNINDNKKTEKSCILFKRRLCGNGT